MEYSKASPSITPRLIIHGGAGNITPSNLSPTKYAFFQHSLLTILSQTHTFLTHPSSFPLLTSPHTSALDAATYAVTLLENNPLFNSGHGAVFTRDGTQELEASIMVSRGYKKRGVGVMGLKRVKNPIKLAREMLVRGERDIEGGNGERRGPMMVRVERGAQGHCQLHGRTAEDLAAEWGLDIVDEGYFFTQARWDEHLKGLEKEERGGEATWDAESFFPQGTCGAVALDASGVLACATSTGGMTNKLSGRIGDTPCLGAGFWAEEWEEDTPFPRPAQTFLERSGPALVLSETLKGLMADCFPSLSIYNPISSWDNEKEIRTGDTTTRATATSGTGNGDSFLRLSAARTISAIAQYSPTSLQSALTRVSGRDGTLQRSAGERWQKTGEGEGGVIGIELTLVKDAHGEVKDASSEIVYDYNCGGMFRAAVNGRGKAVMRVWRKGQYLDADLKAMGYEGEGREWEMAEVVREMGCCRLKL